MPENCILKAWFVFTSVVIYEHKSVNILQIMYALKLSDVWKLACYLHDIWSYCIRSCNPEASKEGHGMMWLPATFPIEYGMIAKKKAGFTPFYAFCRISLIDGKRLLCSHTLLSNLISPSCNLTAQRKFCYLLLFREGTKATTKT